jgi:hypothetical protein
MKKLTLLFFALLTFGRTANAASHYITPAGAGTKSGADWNNACAGFTGSCLGSSMIRGDTYVVAGGSGGSYTTTATNVFSAPDSGATLITVRGARASQDSGVAGWSSTFDVATNPAIFNENISYTSNFSGGPLNSIFWFNTDHWLLDGNTCNGTTLEPSGQGIILNSVPVDDAHASVEGGVEVGLGPVTTDYTIRCVQYKGSGAYSLAGNGIAITSATCSAGVVTAVTAKPIFFVPGSTQVQTGGMSNATFNTATSTPPLSTTTAPVQVFGNKVTVQSTPTGSSFTYNQPGCSGAPATGGVVDGAYGWEENPIGAQDSTNVTITENSLLNSSDGGAGTQGGGGLTVVTYNWFSVNTFSPSQHGNVWVFDGSGPGFADYTGTFAYNMLLDGEGSGAITCLFGCHITGLQIYGNIIANTIGNPLGLDGYGDGVLACINSGTTCNNITYANNTVANLIVIGTGGFDGLGCNTASGTACANWTIQNNLCWNTNYTCDFFGAITGTITENHNTCINPTASITQCASYTGTGDSIQTSAVNPFRLGGVCSGISCYGLISESVDPHLNDGTTLSSPFNLDPFGTTRAADGTWERGAIEFVSAGTVTLLPASYTFATTVVGSGPSSDSPVTFTLANNTGVTISSVAISFTGANAGDFTDTSSCGTTLANGASCPILVTFTPSAAGSRSATLRVSDSDSSSPQTSSLSGTAIPSVINPSPSNPVTFSIAVTDPFIPSTVKNEKRSENLSAYDFDLHALAGFLHQERASRTTGSASQ